VSEHHEGDPVPDASPAASDPSDLGRRVARLRGQRGLTVDEVATAAGMAPEYLHRVEESGSALVSARALNELAAVLGTTTGELLGSGHAHPPGPRGVATGAQLVAVSEDECWRLIGPGGVGRVVFDGARGPSALPVNFRVSDRDVVFRTAVGSPFDGLAGGDPVGFEVDRIDDTFSVGWSVLVTGRLRRARDEAERAALAGLEVEPWSGGGRDTYLVLEVTEITGRRIEAES
jgi:transcriptional regulator with XRE-family HTH domain